MSREQLRTGRERSPISRERSPIVRERSPIVRERSPIIREQSPIIREHSPISLEQSPIIREKLQIVREHLQIIGERSPIIMLDDILMRDFVFFCLCGKDKGNIWEVANFFDGNFWCGSPGLIVYIQFFANFVPSKNSVLKENSLSHE